MSDTLLELRDISKSFSGIEVLHHINFKLKYGEIHALCGENGAGKSTLMNILSGIYPHRTYQGDIIYKGNVCQFKGIKDSEGIGISIIHQEFALVPEMSIAENIFLGNELKKGFCINWDDTYKTADKYLQDVGLQENPKTLVKNLGVGKQQLVEIAKALSKKTEILILDEPTASLNEKDSQTLLNLILELRKKLGITFIIISHKISEISYVADRITVLRDGAFIETLSRENNRFSETRIIKSMVGRELSDRFPKREVHTGEIIFEVKNWNVHHPQNWNRKIIDNVSFHLNKGEILGIAGLTGSGRTELAMSIFGKSYGEEISGEIILHGEKVIFNTVTDAINHGIAYVTEDRKMSGLILSNNAPTNISLANLKGVCNKYILDKTKEKNVFDRYKSKLNIKVSNPDQNVENFSGGNQQKVLLAKWMFTDSEILILDEPTRGIDVGAKHEIYHIINDLVAQGKSIIMISSELPELLGMSDRIYVMSEGKIIKEFDRTTANHVSIMACMLDKKIEG